MPHDQPSQNKQQVPEGGSELNRTPKPLTVLHIATINKPITRANGYGPIETVIFNIDKGLTSLGHHSIVACSSDSAVAGEQFDTIARSLGDYCRTGSAEGQAQVDLHLWVVLERMSDSALRGTELGKLPFFDA